MVAKDKPGLTVWEGGEDSALKFSEIVETLYRELSPLATKKLVCTTAKVEGEKSENWDDTLKRVACEFLANEREDDLESAVSRQLFQALYALDKIEGEQGLDFVVAAVEEFVRGIKCQSGGYLTHGVTIAGLRPMRPVPFKQVFVLGMGEGMFPGRDSASTLEIRGAARTLGDMGATATSKYLFLETLMATRERLVISYPNLDIVKDAELFPSGMVSELEEFLEKCVLPEQISDGGTKMNAKFREVKLPLLERGEKDDFAHDKDEDDICENPVDPIHWSNEYYAGLIPTYSNVERGIAWRIKSAPGVPESEGESASKKSQLTERITLTAKELAEFLESPLRAVLRRLHGIAVEGHRDEALDFDVPLELECGGPFRWSFERELADSIADNPADTDVAGIYRDFAGRGRLPEIGGMLGKYSLDKIKDGLDSKRNDFAALKKFLCSYALQDGDQKPDSIRIDSVGLKNTVERNGDGDDAGCVDDDRLYVGQTKDWSISADGTASRVLVFGKCGDTGREENKQTRFPPKVVLETFVTWMMMVMAERGEREHSLCVGVVDMGEVLFSEWNWYVAPSAAAEYVKELADSYLQFLDEPDAGCYLDYGYSDMAKALAAAVKKRKVRDDVPESDEEWMSVIDEFSSDDFRSGNGGFDGSLVVEHAIEPLSRMPEGKDVEIIRERFNRLFKLPMSGTRNATPKKEA
jgi:hypothetical protein